MDRTLAQLADLAASLTFDDVPQAALHETKRHLLDSLGCALGAFNVEPAEAARRVATGVVGGDLAVTLWGTEHLSSPDLACFANGLMGRYLDFNDQYSGQTTGHPSDVTPAVLAATEVAGRGGRAVITGTLVGYEVFNCLCDASNIRPLWDHPTFGAIASAAAAANVLGLHRDKAAHAISMATVANVSLAQTRRGELSHWKAGAFPNAARQGLFAALLAREGITSTSEPFEGPLGFWAAVSKPFKLAPFGGKGRPFKLMETAFKSQCACYLSLSALDAVLELRRELPSPEDMRELVVYTYQNTIDVTADSAAKWRPQTRETADHSLPFILVTALLEGSVVPDYYTPQRYADHRIQALMDKVRVQEETEYTQRFPQVQTQRVEVVTASGARLSKRVDFPKGHPRNPMSDEEVVAKFRRLVAPFLAEGQAASVVKTVLDLEEAEDLAVLYRELVVSSAPLVRAPLRFQQSCP